MLEKNSDRFIGNKNACTSVKEEPNDRPHQNPPPSLTHTVELDATNRHGDGVSERKDWIKLNGLAEASYLSLTGMCVPIKNGGGPRLRCKGYPQEGTPPFETLETSRVFTAGVAGEYGELSDPSRAGFWIGLVVCCLVSSAVVWVAELSGAQLGR